MENNRIDILDLIDNYNKRTSEKTKEEFLKSKIKIVPYIDYATKIILAKNIILNSCYKNDIFYVDSCKKYLLYIYAILKHWTNLNIEEVNLISQYDLLDRNGLIEKILGLIPEKEISSFGTILEMKENDLMMNERNIHSVVNKNIDKYLPRAFSLFDNVLSFIEKNINRIDKNKIEKILNVVIDKNK